MRRPVFVSLAVDQPSVTCTYAQFDLGMPIADMSTLCTFCTFKRLSEKDEYRPTHSYAGSVSCVFHKFTCLFVLYTSCPLILSYNDELNDDSFLPVRQLDTVVIGRQLQSRRAKQAVTPYGGH